MLLLTLLAVVKTVLTDSLLPRRWQGLSFGLLCAGFVWLCHPYAMEINKLQVENALSEQKALMNISLAVMLDLLLTFGTCWARIVPLRKTRWLRYMPSLLIFPALFYLQINLFFTFAGTSFTAVSVWLAVGIFVILAGGDFAARALLPTKKTNSPCSTCRLASSTAAWVRPSHLKNFVAFSNRIVGMWPFSFVQCRSSLGRRPASMLYCK